MKKTVADTIQNKIKRGELIMRSKLSIWLEKLGIDSGIITILILLVIAAGFIFYWSNNNNDLLFGGYGRYGLLSFIQSFPYLLIFIFILLFMSLAFLFRKFDLSYKKPFMAILAAIFLFVMFFGWFSTRQNFGKRLYQQNNRMFGAGMKNNQNSVFGKVISIEKNSITIETIDTIKIKIIINNDTHFPFGFPKIGNTVRSVGNWENENFKAIGIRVFADIVEGATPGQGQQKGMRWNK